jgi:AcrR family transcriptional regulator
MARSSGRTPLSRERVLRAAVALADEHGLEALSMRRLGRELGVEAMSLYNHVDGKGDLLDGIANLVLAEVELPPDGEGWKAALRANAISAHEVLRRHGWACGLAMSPERNLPARIETTEWILRRLREAGFSAELTYHAYHALDSHVLGFTLWQLGHSFVSDDLPALVAEFFGRLPPDAYPYLREHARQHVSGVGAEGEGAFELVLDLILDGLERRRDAV